MSNTCLNKPLLTSGYGLMAIPEASSPLLHEAHYLLSILSYMSFFLLAGECTPSQPAALSW